MIQSIEQINSSLYPNYKLVYTQTEDTFHVGRSIAELKLVNLPCDQSIFSNKFVYADSITTAQNLLDLKAKMLQDILGRIGKYGVVKCKTC